MRSPISRIMASVVAMLLAATASATVLNVPGQYPTINDACYAAVAGDTVAIEPGSYGASAIVQAGVTVLGLGDGFGDVHVAAGGCGAFTFRPGPGISRLENLEIQGIVCLRNENNGLTLRDCRLLNEDLWYNVLIVTEADINLESCSLWYIYDSTTPVYMEEAASVKFSDCIIIQQDFRFFCQVPVGSHFEFRNCNFYGRVTVDPASSYWAQFSICFVNCIIPRGVCGSVVPDTLEWRYNDFTRDQYPYPEGTYLVGNFTADPLFCGYPSDQRIDFESPCRHGGEGGEDVGARLGYCNVPAQVERDPNAVLGTLWVSPPWPNPTSSGASFAFRSRPGEIVNVQIFDLEGGLIRGMRAAASNDLRIFRWDGRDTAGRPTPAGTYFLQVQAGTDRASRQIVVFQ